MESNFKQINIQEDPKPPPLIDEDDLKMMSDIESKVEDKPSPFKMDLKNIKEFVPGRVEHHVSNIA